MRLIQVVSVILVLLSSIGLKCVYAQTHAQDVYQDYFEGTRFLDAFPTPTPDDPLADPLREYGYMPLDPLAEADPIPMSDPIIYGDPALTGIPSEWGDLSDWEDSGLLGEEAEW